MIAKFRLHIFVLSHSLWGLGQFVEWGGGWGGRLKFRRVVKKESLQILDL